MFKFYSLLNVVCSSNWAKSNIDDYILHVFISVEADNGYKPYACGLNKE